MIEIGSLVRHGDRYRASTIGIVIDHWIVDKSGEYHAVVKWVTGYYTGKRTDEYNEHLEVIA